MELKPVLAPSGFTLPTIHSYPPFFTQQPNPTTWAHHSALWTQLILSYARYRRLFYLRLEDADSPAGEWAEVLRNERIKRTLARQTLGALIEILLSTDRAVREPPKQTSSVLLCWRSIPEWATILHDWAVRTGQTNTILTFYEITNPPVPSDLSDLPEPLLRRAIAQLQRTAKAQIIEGAEGGGVRFFP